MTFKEFVDKWNSMPLRGNGFLALGIDHPLDLQIGHSELDYKSIVIVDSGLIDNIEDSYAVKVSNLAFSSNRTALSFQLVHPEYEEVFLNLCWDMIISSRDAKSPLDSLVGRYKKWQKFLKQSKREKLSTQLQKGLLGEMLFLKRSMKERGEAEAIRAWLGPEGGDQDFVFEEDWVEVKAVAMASQDVSISSMQQLDQEMKGRLVIYTLEKTTPGDNRITVNRMAQNIKSLIEEEQNQELFDIKLFLYGYRKDEEGYYEQNTFRLVECREYSVNKEFPKLVRNNTPKEVTACKYSLSLSAIEKYRI